MIPKCSQIKGVGSGACVGLGLKKPASTFRVHIYSPVTGVSRDMCTSLSQLLPDTRSPRPYPFRVSRKKKPWTRGQAAKVLRAKSSLSSLGMKAPPKLTCLERRTKIKSLRPSLRGSQALSLPESLQGTRWQQVSWVACPITATQSYHPAKEAGPEGKRQTQGPYFQCWGS